MIFLNVGHLWTQFTSYSHQSSQINRNKWVDRLKKSAPNSTEAQLILHMFSYITYFCLALPRSWTDSSRIWGHLQHLVWDTIAWHYQRPYQLPTRPPGSLHWWSSHGILPLKYSFVLNVRFKITFPTDFYTNIHRRIFSIFLVFSCYCFNC